jgi:hypothetical protein
LRVAPHPTNPARDVGYVENAAPAVGSHNFDNQARRCRPPKFDRDETPVVEEDVDRIVGRGSATARVK